MENNKEWYNNETTVDILLFVLFPLGLYAVCKTNSIKFKISKVLYGFLGFLSFFLIIIYVLKL